LQQRVRLGRALNHRFAKDVQRYTNMPLYKQGWIDGFNVYESRYEESIDESTEDYDYY
jgi:hypothetical protein